MQLKIVIDLPHVPPVLDQRVQRHSRPATDRPRHRLGGCHGTVLLLPIIFLVRGDAGVHQFLMNRQSAACVLCAAASGLMFKRWLHLSDDDKRSVWKHYRWFSGLMCFGCCMGAVSFSAWAQWLGSIYSSLDGHIIGLPLYARDLSYASVSNPARSVTVLHWQSAI